MKIDVNRYWLPRWGKGIQVHNMVHDTPTLTEAEQAHRRAGITRPSDRLETDHLLVRDALQLLIARGQLASHGK